MSRDRGWGRSGLTWWSAVTVLLALPTWWVLLRGAVMSRVVDGGIFLSVGGGINDGLSLYSGIWDNKDPLFYGVFALFDRLSPVFAPAPFVTDWLWLLVAALGAGLLASAVASWDRALFVGLVATPWIVAGAAYVPGWSNTPGTALALLSLGLLARRWAIAGGIAVGVLLFTKLALAPIGIAALIVLLLLPSWRRIGVRAMVSLAVSLAVGAGLLALTGSLPGYVEMIGRNRDYASTVMTYFGFTDSIGGHLDKLRSELPWGLAVALVTTVVLIALVTMLLAVSKPWRAASPLPGSRGVVIAWAWISLLGVAGMLALTYVWPHHAQALALPSVLALVLLAALVPTRWWFMVWLVVGLVATLMLSGFVTPSALLERVRNVDAGFEGALAQVDEVPLNATLLNSVPKGTFRYAVLGSNDERGFLRDVRSGATLACPRFHLYDFSPPDDFEEMWACLDTVDALVLTDNFVVFGNGGKAASVQPILGKVGSLFDCMKVEDRQLCTRKRG